VPTLTRALISAAIARELHINGHEVERLTDRTLQLIADALGEGDQVKLATFGTFTIRSRAERPGRNPRTKVPHPIPAHRAVHFVPGEKLKAKLAEGAGDGATRSAKAQTRRKADAPVA
jgi:integration host factor subunit alpha